MNLAGRILILVCSLLLSSLPLVGQQHAFVTLNDVVRAHGAWQYAPQAVQIRGTSTRNGESGPITITATRQEKVVLDYGDTKEVATPTHHFREGDTAFKLEPTLSGFAQLDVTGVFLIAQLRDRAARVDLPSSGTPKFGKRQIHVRSNRKELHFGRFEVMDEADVYLTGEGLLAGIGRTFYADTRYQVNVAVAFSDYRRTGGILLPYRIDRYAHDHVIETILVEAYSFDKPTPASLFEGKRKTR